MPRQSFNSARHDAIREEQKRFAQDQKLYEIDETKEFPGLLDDLEIAKRAYDELVTDKQKVEEELTRRAAKALETQRECWRMGYDGKQVWFDYNVEYQSWRARAVGFKMFTERRLTKAKQALRCLRMKSPKEEQARHGAQVKYNDDGSAFVSLTEIPKGAVHKRKVASVILDYNQNGQLIAIELDASQVLE